MYGLLAAVSLLLTIVSFWLFYSRESTIGLVAAIVFLVATVGLGGVFLSGRVNRKEDIHITE
jgi:hypothetical protein